MFVDFKKKKKFYSLKHQTAVNLVKFFRTLSKIVRPSARRFCDRMVGSFAKTGAPFLREKVLRKNITDVVANTRRSALRSESKNKRQHRPASARGARSDGARRFVRNRTVPVPEHVLPRVFLAPKPPPSGLLFAEHT